MLDSIYEFKIIRGEKMGKKKFWVFALTSVLMVTSVAPAEAASFQFADKDGHTVDAGNMPTTSENDVVSVYDGSLYINGKAVEESLLPAAPEGQEWDLSDQAAVSGNDVLTICANDAQQSDPPADSVDHVEIDYNSKIKHVLQVGSTAVFTAKAYDGEGYEVSGVEFTWKSSDPAVAEVTDDGTVTAKASGSIAITVTVKGTNVRQGFKLLVIDIDFVEIVSDDNQLKVNDSLTCYAYAYHGEDDWNPDVEYIWSEDDRISDVEYTWKSSNPAVAEVTDVKTLTTGGVAKIIGKSAGKATITVTATKVGSSKTKSFDLEVVAVPNEQSKPTTVAVIGIALDKKEVSLEVGKTETLKATIAPAEATNTKVAWKSDNSAVATVDANGMVTAVAAGTAMITVTTEDGLKTAKCEVNVLRPEEKVAPVVKTNAGKGITLQANKSTTAIVASGLVKGDSVKSWTSSKPKVATVKKNGKLGSMITAKKAGTATITVMTKLGAKASFKVTVQKKAVALKNIKVNATKKNLKVKKKYTIVVTKNPLTAQDKVTFKSSNKKIASVSSTGVVTAKKKGKTTITVKAGKKTKTVKITVT